MAAGMLAVLLFVLPGGAYAYFGDTEVSHENQFAASSLGISYTLDTVDDDHREVTIATDGAEDVEYGLTAAATGPFCNNLNVSIKRDGVDVYNGPILTFTTSSIEPLAAASSDQWRFNFSPLDGNGVDGDCDITWSYEANQNGYVHGEAFFDTETDTHTVSGAALGVMPADPGPSPLPTDNIVLNEVYANHDAATSAPNDREWVELYNGTTTAIDVAGWSIGELTGGTATLRTHEIAASCPQTNSAAYAQPYNGASTLIQPGGYLVVEFCAGANYLHDNGDTVTLYDDGATLVDTYTYTSTIQGKSDARIPDGGAWVDPVPTPGMPNKMTEPAPMQTTTPTDTVPDDASNDGSDDNATDQESEVHPDETQQRAAPQNDADASAQESEEHAADQNEDADDGATDTDDNDDADEAAKKDDEDDTPDTETSS